MCWYIENKHYKKCKGHWQIRWIPLAICFVIFTTSGHWCKKYVAAFRCLWATFIFLL